MAEPNIPNKLCKVVLKNTGLKVSKESIEEMKKNLLAYSNTRANEVAEKAKAADRKTILAEDFTA